MEVREAVTSVGGVTVVGSDAPSSYHIAPRTDQPTNSSAPPGSTAFPPPHVVAGVLPATLIPGKKKRGRPRKYRPDGSAAKPLSPKPISSAAPVPPPVIDFSAEKRPKVEPASKKYEPPAEKFEHAAPVGEWVSCSVGANFTPHIITVNAGEDVTMKIISFSQQGPRAICILSANGIISNVTLRQPDSSGGTLTYEGRFEILSLSGSFMPSESEEGTRSRTGGMSVSLASPDGRVVGGGIAGLLIAASPVQVVVGSFLAGNQHEQNPKKHNNHNSFTITTTSAIPVSVADPTPTPFRGDTWSAAPPDSRSNQNEINMTTVHAG
ncbi:AT-hook motif nuclear-localized protein 1 [Linum grandiflorum]